MIKRIFKSALNDVKYVADNERPMTIKQFIALSPEQQAALKAKAAG